MNRPPPQTNRTYTLVPYTTLFRSPHVAVKARKFDPDRARPDDEQFLRHFGRDERVAIGPDALAVGGCERQVASARAGGDDDILGGERFGPLLAFDFQLARRGELALAHMDGDLVLLHQEGDALAQRSEEHTSEL